MRINENLDVSARKTIRSRRNVLKALISLKVIGATGGLGLFVHPTIASAETMSFAARAADVIIPRTETISGSDAGADIFALHIIETALKPEDTQIYLEGMVALRQRLETSSGFGASQDGQNSLAEKFRTILQESDDKPEAWFLRRFRRLILLGWALSEEGAKSAFSFDQRQYSYQPRTDNPKIIMGSFMDKEYIPL